MAEVDIAEVAAQRSPIVAISTPGMQRLSELAIDHGLVVVCTQGERVVSDRVIEDGMVPYGTWEVRFVNDVVLAFPRPRYHLRSLNDTLIDLGDKLEVELDKETGEGRRLLHKAYYRRAHKDFYPACSEYEEYLGSVTTEHTMNLVKDIGVPKTQQRRRDVAVTARNRVSLYPDTVIAAMAVQQGLHLGGVKIDGGHFKAARRALRKNR